MMTLTLAAEALMDLRPWNYWKKDGSPCPGTTQLVAVLDTVLARNPNHPGACHYYIHAVEAVAPSKAVPCAERLAALMPGVGHMVHMPAHIYLRVGRYNDAIEANTHAVHTDEHYIAAEHPDGVYPAAYYPHNYHFLAFAATMAGRSEQAVEAARAAAAHTPPEVARLARSLELVVASPYLIMQTFGRWDDILALPDPPADLQLASGMVAYARGMAYLGKDRMEPARAALATVRAAVPGVAQGNLRASLRVGEHVLAAEIARREGHLDDAARHLEMARQLEDGMNYIEPPYWHQPVRHMMGALLIEAGRPQEAERLYLEDLKRFPENMWSLAGLEQSPAAQGRADEANDVHARLVKAQAGSDVPLSRSRM
ncbi:MAG: tetratricopeptide repeat protein [Gemmatimonadota bacterium]